MRRNLDRDIAANWVRPQPTKFPSLQKQSHIVSFDDSLAKLFELNGKFDKTLTKPSFLFNSLRALPKLKILRGKAKLSKLSSTIYGHDSHDKNDRKTMNREGRSHKSLYFNPNQTLVKEDSSSSHVTMETRRFSNMNDAELKQNTKPSYVPSSRMFTKLTTRISIMQLDPKGLEGQIQRPVGNRGKHNSEVQTDDSKIWGN